MNLRTLTRFQAAGWHFSVSLVLGLAVFLLFRFVWYPGALWDLSAAGKLLLLVVAVDVTLGPLLTLVVFNPRKKSLPFDLAVIFAVQVAALSYGIWVMAQSRPVFLVAAVDRFVLVRANDVAREDLALAQPEYRKLSWTGPVTVGTRSTLQGEQRMEQIMRAASGGADIDRLPQFYVDIAEVADVLIGTSESLADLEQRAPEHVAAMKALLDSADLSTDRARFVLFAAPKGFGTAVIDRESGELLATSPIDIH